ncbi:MAG: 16S rRNA (cytidine(1402)-2'-O)-methyltransferase [Pseudomonadota bacterium]
MPSSDPPSDPSQSPSGPSAARAAGQSWRDPRAGPDGEQAGAPGVPLAPGLYVVSTPIGNLRDVTLRALDILSSVDQILAEDTRVARKLLDAYGIKGSVTPYHDHNGAQRRPGIIKALAQGETIALVSDAGTPLISDPGFKLVRDAAAAGAPVFPIPGASALLSGLVVAGLPSDRFLFVGFLPPKSAARTSALTVLANVDATLVAYESGPRLAGMLSDAASTLGDARPAAVARELTKRFEETRRDSLGDLARYYGEAGGPKGEIVVLIGPPVHDAVTPRDLDDFLETALEDLPVKAAAEAASDALGVPRREAYQRALAIRAARNG